ncbi:hypothetical protein TNCV_527381 [Trichonephila clavipes]|nr:hypothetical protein TNCV_527381 [Trichonephila clavipes]
MKQNGYIERLRNISFGVIHHQHHSCQLQFFGVVDKDRRTMVIQNFVEDVVPARISSQSSRHRWRSPLPHASALIQRDFRCVFVVQQTTQLLLVATFDQVWQLGDNRGQSLSNHRPHVFYRLKDPESEPAREAIKSGD